MAGVRLLVSSCDAYADCWAPFFHGLRTYWPDCPYPVSLIANQASPSFAGVSVIAVGPDQGWASNLLAALDQIDEPHVLYCQEDYWISRTVDQAAIASYAAFAEEADYVRLMPQPPPDGAIAADERLAAVGERAEYRTSLQMALWRADALRASLLPGQTPWQFEVAGDSGRLRAYCVREPADGIGYVLAVARGRWCRSALEYAQREGLELDLSRRPTEGRLDTFLAFSRMGRSMVAGYRGAKLRLGAR